MFGISNYVFIIVGICFIVSALWNYKVVNTRIWGHYRKKKGIVGGIAGFIYRYDIVRDYWDGLLGTILCLIGIYGLINDIHETDDIELSDMTHEIFHKDKEDDTNKI